MSGRRECAANGCNTTSYGRGLCATHYRRAREAGALPDPIIRPRDYSDEEREAWFWRKVDKSGKCWSWKGALDKGYGHCLWNGKRKKVHRVAYELLVGKIPEGLVIDHLCRNRSCVNPDHMEPVTNEENVRRGMSPAAIAWRAMEAPDVS